MFYRQVQNITDFEKEESITKMSHGKNSYKPQEQALYIRTFIIIFAWL